MTDQEHYSKQSYRCGSCTCYQETQPGIGECRRHPPVLLVSNPSGLGEIVTRWPAVLCSEWCMGWRRRLPAFDSKDVSP